MFNDSEEGIFEVPPGHKKFGEREKNIAWCS